jgi:hypothetical protein
MVATSADESVSAAGCKVGKVQTHREAQDRSQAKSVEREQRKAIVVGDSHARGCATEVNRLLKEDCEVLGFVNAGSGMKCIKDTAKVKLQQLSKEDVLVLWGGGSNGIARNSTVGMRHLLDFVINATRTNVILMSAPIRHDLMSSRCVNKEIEKFSRKLRLRLERPGRVEMM